ncbi:UNVERIFIED_CONTAM: Pentatricopeptide repeat-containing protein, chloroplastic [Sesamum indicum]
MGFGKVLHSKIVKSGVECDVMVGTASVDMYDEGLETLSKMEKYGLTANIKHYGCLVDLMGGASKLQDAFNLVKRMPMAPNDRLLGALRWACRIHSDTTMAENVLELVSKLNSYRVFHDDTHYLLLSNIYAASERWEMAKGKRVVLSAKGSKKTPYQTYMQLLKDGRWLKECELSFQLKDLRKYLDAMHLCFKAFKILASRESRSLSLSVVRV